MNFLSKLLVLLLFAPVSQAAEISVTLDQFSKAVVEIKGEIVPGDFEKVVTASREVIKHENYDKLQFDLNSAGGNVIEAMKIGEFARERLAHIFAYGNRIVYKDSEDGKFVLNESTKGDTQFFKGTIVVDNRQSIKPEQLKKCYSACVLILYGGVSRTVTDNHIFGYDQRPFTPKGFEMIGLHRPYFDQKEFAQFNAVQARKEYKKLEELVRSYLNDMGAPDILIERMLKSSSVDVELVSSKEFGNYYHDRDPYFEEWKLARCGGKDGKQKLKELNTELYENFVGYREAISKEVKRRDINWEKISSFYKTYVPPGFNKNKYDMALRLVRIWNKERSECGDNLIKDEQIKWANSATN
jgi:hypothetical protein